MTKKDYTPFTAEERIEIRRLIRQNKKKWTAISVVWILFAAFVIYAYLQNKERVDDIQKARVESCVKTYQSFHDVFAGLIPPPGQRTAKIQADIDHFNDNINRLKAGCGNQTRVKQ